ncbi:hypothetical protein RF11_03100 [Thelohanellus kitauei]|uniref:Uncharacterized protein n=1 Tax=Thelohanellus kitauei TaxID=669202 RepID=A0A0C2J5X6_THEKT|nr:hypothetical protein RF11_03100 [Thelohanellus kitauei]
MNYEFYRSSKLDSFLYIKCKIVDTTEYIEIRECNMSAKTDEFNRQIDHSFDDEWNIQKKTKYEIENLKKTFNIDQSGSKYLRFGITKMTIEPQNYTQICTLKQSTMGVNENEFTCVNILPVVNYSNTNISITPINQDILDENISKKYKLRWCLLILIVPFTIILTLYIS